MRRRRKNVSSYWMTWR